MKTVVIDSVEDDDWIRSLPGYKTSERRLHRKIKRQLTKKKAKEYLAAVKGADEEE